MTGPLWQPSQLRISETNLTRFLHQVESDWGPSFNDYEALHHWSITEMEAFWRSAWHFCGVIAENDGPVLINGGQMPGAKFYPEARLNFAENLLRRRDGADAIVFWGEDKVKRRLSYRALYDQVSCLAQALSAEGVGPGHRQQG